MIVAKYEKAARDNWNAFVKGSKNGTFLFLRDYMDYHSDRFDDESLMISDSGRLIALLPANRVENSLVSHGGLTYGGVITDTQMTTPKMLAVFGALLSYGGANGIERIQYKCIPSIYCREPAQEDLYALFKNGAKLARRDVLSVVAPNSRVAWQKRRQRAVTKAANTKLGVRQTSDYESFWALLTRNLNQHHNTAPVHSVTEIEALASTFREQIALYGCYQKDDLLAGAVLYLSDRVCHVQYNATSEEGRVLGALDLLFSTLLARYLDENRYFDFGISTEQDGLVLNSGLVQYKEGFGARAMVHDFYDLPLGSFE